MIGIMHRMNSMSLTVSLDTLAPTECSEQLAAKLGYRTVKKCLRSMACHDHFAGHNFLQLKRMASEDQFIAVPVKDRQNQTVGRLQAIEVGPGSLSIEIADILGDELRKPVARFWLDSNLQAFDSCVGGTNRPDQWNFPEDWLACIPEDHRQLVRQVLNSPQVPGELCLYYPLISAGGRLVIIEHQVRVTARRAGGAETDNLLFVHEGQSVPFSLKFLALLLNPEAVKVTEDALIDDFDVVTAAGCVSRLQTLLDRHSSVPGQISLLAGEPDACAVCGNLARIRRPAVSIALDAADAGWIDGLISSRSFDQFLRRNHQLGVHTAVLRISESQLCLHIDPEANDV
jgi:hypothetical protein